MLRNYADLCFGALRLAFFACLVLLVALSWLPAEEMVRTGVSARVEHVVAYLGTAIIMALAYRERPRLAVQCLLLVMLAGILEVGQRYMPGRNADILDYVASSSGAILGGLLMWSLRPGLLGYLGLNRAAQV